MQVIKGINKIYIEQLKQLHQELFHEQAIDANFDFEVALNLKQCYLLINEQTNEVVSFIGMSEKLISYHHLKIKIALIGCIMTNPKYQRQGYAKQLLEIASEDYLQHYESVIIQAWNWEIYKSFKLENTTIKYAYQFNENNQSNNQLEKTIFKPSIYRIKKIQKQKNNNLYNVLETSSLIHQKIKLYKQHQLNFIANDKAYIWYDNNHQIDHFIYYDINSLMSLINYIKPTNEILLFEKNYEHTNLINLNKQVIVTKTFTNSKLVIKNINLVDFVM